MMRVAAILPGAIEMPRAVHIYRITLPFNTIREKTKHNMAWISSFSVATELSQKQRDHLLSSDIIVIARPITNNTQEAFEFMELLKSRGAKVVYETDDDLTEIFRDISDGENKTSIPYLYLCDASTVSTEPLAKRVGIYTSKPVYVLPNKIAPQFFKKATMGYEREFKDTLNIMLVGTQTHGDDWYLASIAASKILDEHPNTRLLIGGFHPDYIDRTDRVELIPFKPYYAYPTTLAEADIVIAAIDPDDGFNQCKSAVKAMEAWAARRKLPNGMAGGAAVIATDSIVYSGTIIDGINGMLVEHTVKGYYDALKILVENENLRIKLQRRGLSSAMRKHSINQGYRNWLSAYTRILRS